MFGHSQSPNAFHKPATVTFKFVQKRFDKSGELQDQHGVTVYKFIDEGEKHTFGFVKSYPLEIHRASDNRVIAKIYWDDKPKKATVEGLGGRHDKINISNGLMNADLQWRMPDDSMFEWDGVWGYPFKLLDYRIAQTYSMSPAVVAQFTPQGSKKSPATLEVLRDALSVPHFLDYLVTTSIWMEYFVYTQKSNQEAASIGAEIGAGVAGG